MSAAMNALTGKVAIVTGVSKGIGAGIAKHSLPKAPPSS
jgi:NAD(P)-dependent dehydrogenase (short-subunit alcohol dehydrogenase family)